MIAVMTAVCAAVFAAAAAAHHSPNDVIEALSVTIEERGATAALLVQRAYEYRAVGDDRAAEADLQAALDRQPGNLDALIGIARVCMNAGRLQTAEQHLEEALAQSLDETRAAPIHALFAELRELEGDGNAALDQWEKALRSERCEVDWYLRHAAMLQQLGRVDDARKALETAKSRNASAVIYRAWLAALIDAGQFATARFHIDAELAGSRWKSSWLLMRARLQVAQGAGHAAQLDAQLALDEIHVRKNPERPDPFLLVDEALALAVLGEPAKAQALLDQAAALDVPESAMRPVRSLVDSAMLSKR